jgi:hypothetical protein
MSKALDAALDPVTSAREDLRGQVWRWSYERDWANSPRGERPPLRAALPHVLQRLCNGLMPLDTRKGPVWATNGLLSVYSPPCPDNPLPRVEGEAKAAPVGQEWGAVGP